jgi:anthranilate phosphoribosyltransferase
MAMNLSGCLKEIARTDEPRDLSEQEAHLLFAAMLDGGVADLELGACLTALHMKPESAVEMLGFHRAASERVYGLRAPDTGLRPLVFGSYGGARRQANLLPLLVLMLQRIGVPVLLHGTLEGGGRVASAYILRELGILPCGSLSVAQESLDRDMLAFVPTAVLCPGLANLLALRNRMGICNPAHRLTGLLDPFGGMGLRVTGATDAAQLARIEAFLVATGFDALLLRSTEGEAFANPRQRPRIQFYRQGEGATLFEEEMAPSRALPGEPAGIEAAATAAWIRQALAGEVPIPHPLVNQLACCLHASGYTEDMNQAKAIAAVETGSLIPAPRARGAEAGLPRVAG